MLDSHYHQERLRSWQPAWKVRCGAGVLIRAEAGLTRCTRRCAAPVPVPLPGCEVDDYDVGGNGGSDDDNVEAGGRGVLHGVDHINDSNSAAADDSEGHSEPAASQVPLWSRGMTDEEVDAFVASLPSPQPCAVDWSGVAAAIAAGDALGGGAAEDPVAPDAAMADQLVDAVVDMDLRVELPADNADDGVAAGAGVGTGAGADPAAAAAPAAAAPGWTDAAPPPANAKDFIAAARMIRKGWLLRRFRPIEAWLLTVRPTWAAAACLRVWPAICL
jgi:hypothetical protein